MFAQSMAISRMNFHTLPQRKTMSIVAIVGIAGVVAVLVGVLSMATGFERTMLATGSIDSVVILRAGSLSELNSSISYEESLIMSTGPEVARAADRPLASAELYVIVDLPKRSTGSLANVPLRGVQPQAFLIKENFKIIAGRPFEPGRNELIVGRNAQQQFIGLDIGSEIQFGRSEWKVVGIFEDNNSASASELWCDIRVLQAEFHIGNSFQSVRVKLRDPDLFGNFAAGLRSDPRLNLSIQTETEYYAEQSKGLVQFIKGIGYPLALLMGLGAVFAALNTMYSSVSARKKEIATLRALGFSALPVAVSILLESMLLALIGGAVGGSLVYIVFNDYQVATMNSQSFSQIAFNFAVTPGLLMEGIQWAMVIGVVGGLLPAIRASRLPVTQALREL